MPNISNTNFLNPSTTLAPQPQFASRKTGFYPLVMVTPEPKPDPNKPWENWQPETSSPRRIRMKKALIKEWNNRIIESAKKWLLAQGLTHVHFGAEISRLLADPVFDSYNQIEHARNKFRPTYKRDRITRACKPLFANIFEGLYFTSQDETTSRFVIPSRISVMDEKEKIHYFKTPLKTARALLLATVAEFIEKRLDSHLSNVTTMPLLHRQDFAYAWKADVDATERKRIGAVEMELTEPALKLSRQCYLMVASAILSGRKPLNSDETTKLEENFKLLTRRNKKGKFIRTLAYKPPGEGARRVLPRVHLPITQLRVVSNLFPTVREYLTNVFQENGILSQNNK